MPTKLYIGNLAYAVTDQDLATLFAQAGKVDSAVVVTDKFSGQSRGFGFVEMADGADAARAIETLNDADLKGRRIRVAEARASTRGPGGGGGGGGGGGERRRGGGGGGWGGGRGRS
ncbi:MAG TPA: RNA-binding protein [Candidatus Binataceae bacterium]|nr:RNA-binding protein [Candidatus Binataceae bacterium]